MPGGHVALRGDHRLDLCLHRLHRAQQLADLVAATRHLVGPSGRWMAMKGRRPDEEMAALPEEVEVFHVEPVAVPGLAADRCIVWMRDHRS